MTDPGFNRSKQMENAKNACIHSSLSDLDYGYCKLLQVSALNSF